jgi:hypothetical protein
MMNASISGLSARITLYAAIISALLGAAAAQTKGGSPSWQGLTYHRAMLGTHGAYGCDASGRARLARPAVRLCRPIH